MTTEAWTDTRDEEGAFLGMVNHPPGEFQVYLAVTCDTLVAFNAPLTSPVFERIRLERALWHDRATRPIWRLAEGTMDLLARSPRFVCVGAVCETQWGEELRRLEALARFLQLMRFHNLDTTKEVPQ